MNADKVNQLKESLKEKLKEYFDANKLLVRKRANLLEEEIRKLEAEQEEGELSPDEIRSAGSQESNLVSDDEARQTVLNFHIKRIDLAKINESLMQKLNEIYEINIKQIDEYFVKYFEKHTVESALKNNVDTNNNSTSTRRQQDIINKLIGNHYCLFIKFDMLKKEFKVKSNPIGILLVTDWYLNENQLNYLNIALKKPKDESAATTLQHQLNFALNEEILYLHMSLFASNFKKYDQFTKNGFLYIKKQAAVNKLEQIIEFYFPKCHMSKIEDNTFGKMCQLKRLKISPERLDSLAEHALYGLNKLEELELNDINLLHIESNSFKSLVNLTKLDLSKNKLRKISSNTFSGLKNLVELDLCYNQLEEIDNNSFAMMNNLRELHLKENRLIRVSEGMLNGLFNLKGLWLCGNPIQDIDDNTCKYFDKLIELVVDTKQLNLINMSKVFQNNGIQCVRTLVVDDKKCKRVNEYALKCFKKILLVEFYLNKTLTDRLIKLKQQDKLNKYLGLPAANCYVEFNEE